MKSIAQQAMSCHKICTESVTVARGILLAIFFISLYLNDA
ncbi:hypothetical protein F652_309 [Enterobacteriaceae bacterium bta3-1]|nr:hypothetical protein F652_309 [Enterobacteriaceae bacterium bta3-1]